ncbi:MAG: ATP-binding cassette domain-containing protein [Pirellulaceae bacterium]
MASSLLVASHLGRRHPDREGWLLEDISLEIRGGDRLALRGPSGSGKTLLMRALVLLDPLDAGEIRWRGEPVCRDRVPIFRREAIYLHQRPAFSPSTVEDALKEPLTLYAHRHRRYDRERMLLRLDQLGRADSFLTKRIADLSGGELQITALLRALQLEPTMLFLDEPTAALDAQTVAAVEGFVSDWVDEAPDLRAFVWVGHDESQHARVTQRSVTIRAGRLVSNTESAGNAQ